MNLIDIEKYLQNLKTRNHDHNQIEELFLNLKRIKSDAVVNDNQSMAKKIWIYEQIVKVQNLYLKAFQELKADDYYKAWCTLGTCELELRFLARHHQILNNDCYSLDFIQKHVKKYQSIFPYKAFGSIEILDLEKKCTICGQKISIRKPCGHEVCEIYNGEMCAREVTNAKYLGVALVESPLNRYAVPFLIDPKTKQTIDHYNYATIKYLVRKLQSPFDTWDVNFTKRLYPHSKFKTIGRNDQCPCNSGKKYEKCCLQKRGVELQHVEFIFSV